MNLVPRNAVEQKIHAILSFSLHIYHICCYYVLASQRLDNHYPENSWGSFIFLQSMMTARVITTILWLRRPRQACIVVMTLAVIMLTHLTLNAKNERHPPPTPRHQKRSTNLRPSLAYARQVPDVVNNVVACAGWLGRTLWR